MVVITTFALDEYVHARQPLEPLTSHEQEVLVPVAQGRTNDESATEPYISTNTVKTHLACRMRKLGARNRVELAMWAPDPPHPELGKASGAVVAVCA